MTTSPESKLVISRRSWRMLALALLVTIAPAAKAQENSAGSDRDPPSRAARVVEVVGDAWLFDPDTREWTRLTRNQTVAEGDRLRTDERSRVSLRVGSTSVWVDERSDLELSQLDDGHTLLQLDRGDVALRLRTAENVAETRLRTREGTAQPEREGLYRVEQLDRGTKVYVWQGRMRFEWARSAAPLSLGGGEQAELWWPDGPRAERSALYSDGFGDWVLAESREEGDRSVARYVSPEMTGAEDLDRYGRWETAPEYGTVWIPTTHVTADWAPYRNGRWAWSRHWGWTWVDDAPWGFAPFHYGRWVSWGGRWCWAPGPYVHRPVYAPALVGWIGGSHVSVGISIGGRTPPPRYGWYPLAPREVYVPGYRHSPRYVHRVNDPRDVRDPVTVKRPHRYRDAPNAVSTLPVAGGAIGPGLDAADEMMGSDSGSSSTAGSSTAVGSSSGNNSSSRRRTEDVAAGAESDAAGAQPDLVTGVDMDWDSDFLNATYLNRKANSFYNDKARVPDLLAALGKPTDVTSVTLILNVCGVRNTLTPEVRVGACVYALCCQMGRTAWDTRGA